MEDKDYEEYCKEYLVSMAEVVEVEDDCCIICGGPLLAPYNGGFTGSICEGCDD